MLIRRLGLLAFVGTWSTHFFLCRFLLSRRQLGLDSRRLTNFNGIERTVDELFLVAVMVDCTFTILEIWLLRENRSGRICRRLLRGW